MKDGLVPDFGRRLETEELMDRPDADLELLRRTIAQFALINRLMSSAFRLAVSRLFPLMERGGEQVIVDVGAGGCDIDLRLVRAARRRGLRLRIIALDRDERIIPWAKEAVRGYPEIEVVRGEAGDLGRMGFVDFVMSNHLMHHLTWEEIGTLLEAADRIARKGLLLDDLRRSTLSWIGYSAYAALFARRSLAFVDGRLSIRRGFSRIELQALLERRLPGSRAQVFTAAPGRVGFIRTSS